MLAEHPDAIGRIANLGTGTSHSMEELVDVVGRVLGRDLRVVQDPARVRPERSEVRDLCADIRLARSLGWTPEVSLERGVHQVVDFFRQLLPEPGAVSREYRI